MNIERKTSEEVVELLLEEMFYKDFNDAKLCASDRLYYHTKETAKEDYFNRWLVQKGFATEII